MISALMSIEIIKKREQRERKEKYFTSQRGGLLKKRTLSHGIIKQEKSFGER
jgi:hypothetical protein